jgi:hypothetical protein
MLNAMLLPRRPGYGAVCTGRAYLPPILVSHTKGRANRTGKERQGEHMVPPGTAHVSLRLEPLKRITSIRSLSDPHTGTTHYTSSSPTPPPGENIQTCSSANTRPDASQFRSRSKHADACTETCKPESSKRPPSVIPPRWLRHTTACTCSSHTSDTQWRRRRK